MKGVVMLPVVFLASWLSVTSSSLDPGKQAEVLTLMNSAQYILNTINGETQTQLEAVKEALKVSSAMESNELLNQQTTLLNIASNVGRALKAIQGAAAVASFIFTFFMPSELSVITDLVNKRFDKVNGKLDRLDEKLDRMELSIKTNTEFNTFLALWITWEYASKNGAKKLSDIRNAMSGTNRKIEKVKLAEEYIKYYENNNLGGNLLNLYRMAALPDSSTNRNIFERFKTEFSCDIVKLSKLMIIIQNVMTSAAQQELTYYYFKGDESRAENHFIDVQNYFFEIRRAFDDRVWYCKSRSIDLAKDDAKKIILAMKDSSKENVAQAIFKELKVKYPWYTWAVAAGKDVGRTGIRGLESRGNTFFSVGSYYIVHEDTNVLHVSCVEIKQAKTLLVFRQCSGCNSNYIYVSDNILSRKKCPGSTLEQLVLLKDELMSKISSCRGVTNADISNYFGLGCHRNCRANVELCVKRLKTEIQSLDFIASAVNIDYNVCEPNTCSGNGQCKSIPFTTTHQCICNSYHEGESCEKRIKFNDTVEKMLSKLRQTFNVVNGVPTAVNNYFAIMSLSEKLDLVLQKITASFGHTNNIIKHSTTIYVAEDIADLYDKLQKDMLTFDQFGQQIQAVQKLTPFQLQNRINKIILPTGRTLLDRPGDDIYNSYKREYTGHKGGGCSTKYNADIKSFRDYLSHLDQVLGEALLRYKDWLIKTKGTTDALRAQYEAEAVMIYDSFKDHQEEYKAYWKSYSCGPISIPGTGVDCKSELTYDGMVITLQCDQQRQATPLQLTCKRDGDLLKWDSQPTCKFVWGNFGAWGACSKSCDGGYKMRYRKCLGTYDFNNCKRDQGGSHSQSVICNTQPCCASNYGKFKCSNGKCITASFVCDGDNDCGNGDDESRSRCPTYIRSGGATALENSNPGNGWLSCYCTANCGRKYCTTSYGCPGKNMEDAWGRCGDMIFYIDASTRKYGEGVRVGDLVAFNYAGSSNWLSCWGSEGHSWIRGKYCWTTSCPSGVKNFPLKKHGCDGEKFYIRSIDRPVGSLIYNWDAVFIQYRSNWFLSSDRNYVRTRTCPGWHLDKSDWKCSDEIWKIVQRQW